MGWLEHWRGSVFGARRPPYSYPPLFWILLMPSLRPIFNLSRHQTRATGPDLHIPYVPNICIAKVHLASAAKFS